MFSASKNNCFAPPKYVLSAGKVWRHRRCIHELIREPETAKPQGGDPRGDYIQQPRSEVGGAWKMNLCPWRGLCGWLETRGRTLKTVLASTTQARAWLSLRLLAPRTYPGPLENVSGKDKTVLKNGRGFEQVVHKHVIPDGQWTRENGSNLFVTREMYIKNTMRSGYTAVRLEKLPSPRMLGAEKGVSCRPRCGHAARVCKWCPLGGRLALL